MGVGVVAVCRRMVGDSSPCRVLEAVMTWIAWFILGWAALCVLFVLPFLIKGIRQERRHRPISEHTAEYWQ